MYLPPQFNAKDQALAEELMRTYPLATLITTDDDGLPVASHLPLNLNTDEQPWRLFGHCARANPQWKHLQNRAQALVSFMGPQTYMTPRVYPDLARVPTWLYLAVQCKVEARLIDEPVPKDGVLKKLINDHDPAYVAQWIGLGEAYQHKMLKGIVAFELTITSLQCAIKVNQHRPEAPGAMHMLFKDGDANQRMIARWMERLGLLAAAQAADTTESKE